MTIAALTLKIMLYNRVFTLTLNVYKLSELRDFHLNIIERG